MMVGAADLESSQGGSEFSPLGAEVPGVSEDLNADMVGPCFSVFVHSGRDVVG